VNRPRLTIIAGANGSGKTTLTRLNRIDFREFPLLDPDVIGKTLQTTLPRTFPIAAARQVLTSAREHVRNSKNFAIETTLSGKNYLQMMLDAQARRFEIMLVYIGTENVEINLARIRHRVLRGGHDVPEQDVRRRYQRSLANLPLAIERADRTILFDNSAEQGYRLVAVLGASINHRFPPIPDWAIPITGRFF
jgi:predicted ABC-type ATPase